MRADVSVLVVGMRRPILPSFRMHMAHDLFGAILLKDASVANCLAQERVADSEEAEMLELLLGDDGRRFFGLAHFLLPDTLSNIEGNDKRPLITDLTGLMPVRSFLFVVMPENRLFLEMLLHSEYILPGPAMRHLAPGRRVIELAVSHPRFQASQFDAAELGDLLGCKC